MKTQFLYLRTFILFILLTSSLACNEETVDGTKDTNENPGRMNNIYNNDSSSTSPMKRSASFNSSDTLYNDNSNMEPLK